MSISSLSPPPPPPPPPPPSASPRPSRRSALQAIARDDIYPILKFFGFDKGTRRGDEPRRAVFITWAMANGFGYFGGAAVNGIAAILTDFFLTAYFFVNVSALVLFLTNAPNWRPTFSFTRWYMSLFGASLSLLMMWYLSTTYAAVTTGIWVFLFLYVRFTATEKTWGDIGQAMLYRVLASNSRSLMQRKDNPKFWRSNILLLAEKADMPALKLCREVTRDGLLMIGTAVPNEGSRFGAGDLGTAAAASAATAAAAASSAAAGGSINGGMSAAQAAATAGSFTATSRHRRASTSVLADPIKQMLPRHSSDAARVKAAWLWLIQHAKLEAFSVVGTGDDPLEHKKQLENLLFCLQNFWGLEASLPQPQLQEFPKP